MIKLIRQISTIAISLTLIFCSVVPVFAEPTEEQYVYINNKSEAVAAIQAYLNYRGLGVICDVEKAADEWLINQQIELQELLSGIEKTPAGILKFRYDVNVLLKLNSLVGDLTRKYNFAEFNDENTSQTEQVYSGYLISDPDGVKVLVYMVNTSGTGTRLSAANYSGMVDVGGYYKYPLSYFDGNNGNMVSGFSVDDSSLISSYSTALGPKAESTYLKSLGYCLSNSLLFKFVDGNSNISFNYNQGYTVIRDIYGHYYLGSIAHQVGGGHDDTWIINSTRITSSPTETPSDVEVYTPKGVLPDPPEPFEPVIPKDSQGNTYNYNDYQTYIDNSVTNNTTYYPSADEEPETPDTPTVPDFPGGTWNPDGNGGYNFDIDLPDFSVINWSLNGNNISQKFPFSIPWDLMAFFSVLNAEPETPELQGEIDLGIVTWEIDWNLHQFDGIAAIARNMEFIAFCIGLILATRSLIKG